AAPVEEGDRAPLRTVATGGFELDALSRELCLGALAELVVTERREEQRCPRELRQLHDRHGASPGGLVPRALGLHDLAGARHVRDLQEIDPLDMSHDGEAHSLRRLVRIACRRMLETEREEVPRAA